MQYFETKSDEKFFQTAKNKSPQQSCDSRHMYSWLLSVYFYFPLVVSCLKFWCCFAEEGIIKVPYKLFPINSFQGQARRRGEKRKSGVKKVFMPSVCHLSTHLHSVWLSLKHWITFLQVPFLACLLWEGDGSEMLCLNSSAATDFKLLWGFQDVKAFYPVQVCALMCPGIALDGLQWDNPLLANGAESLWVFSSVRKYFQSSFTLTTS